MLISFDVTIRRRQVTRKTETHMMKLDPVNVFYIIIYLSSTIFYEVNRHTEPVMI